jgi:signal transduction histidine kinase
MGDERLDLLLPEGTHLETRQVRWTPVATVQSPHLLVTIRDLTPEQRALQQQKTFMTELTHELRTPLTIVSGSLLRLQRESDLTVRVQRHVTRAAEEATRIHRLLEHLSLMVRLEVDPAWLGLRDQALLPVVDEWGRSCPDAIRKRLRIETQVTGSDQVRMDANALVVVLDQLLENAVTHGAENRDVMLQVFCPDGSDRCSLSMSSLNRQPAVDESTINSWLKPFVRGGSPRDGVQVEGPGLGLALVRQLVEAWGGVLELHQEDDPQSTGWTLTQVAVTVPLSASSELEGSREVGERDRV